ncbi:hypothetical protein X801_10349, partial [Opisthorchis viverrini]
CCWQCPNRRDILPEASVRNSESGGPVTSNRWRMLFEQQTGKCDSCFGVVQTLGSQYHSSQRSSWLGEDRGLSTSSYQTPYRIRSYANA